MTDFAFANGDVVSKIRKAEERIVIQQRESPKGPMYWIQLGRDAATATWAHEHELELVRKGKSAPTEPGFVPSRGIMD